MKLKKNILGVDDKPNAVNFPRSIANIVLQVM